MSRKLLEDLSGKEGIHIPMRNDLNVLDFWK